MTNLRWGAIRVARRTALSIRDSVTGHRNKASHQVQVVGLGVVRQLREVPLIYTPPRSLRRCLPRHGTGTLYRRLQSQAPGFKEHGTDAIYV